MVKEVPGHCLHNFAERGEIWDSGAWSLSRPVRQNFVMLAASPQYYA